MFRTMDAPAGVLAAAAEEAQLEEPDEGPQAAPAGRPLPPYDQTYQIQEGVKCYYPGCPHKSYEWGKLLDHVKNIHKWKHSELQGTYLHTMGLQDNMVKQAEYRKRKRAAKAKASHDGGAKEGANTGTTGQKEGEEGTLASSSAAVLVAERKDKGGVEKKDEEDAEGDGTQWLGVMCWVKCDKEGTPLQPLICAGPCSSTPKPVPKQLAMQPCGQLPTQASSGGAVLPAPVDMLTEVWKHQKMQQVREEKEKAWQQGLPEVFVKPSYLSHAGVPAKGEMVGGKPCKRADWPSDLSEDFVEVSDFQKWLVADRLSSEKWAKDRCRDVGRLLGALVCQGSTPCSTECMVAMGLNDTYKQLFAMPLMASKYSWTEDAVDSFLVYLDYHQDLLQQKIKKQVEGPWGRHITIISGMGNKIKTGIRPKCVRQSNKNIRTKAKDDQKAIANLPSPAVLHKAVSDGYKCLIRLHAEYKGKESMPPLHRAKATACMAGATALDTYQGRQNEWSLLEQEYMQRVLQGDQEYLECEEHKTAKFYGDVYKWLSPSLKKAMLLYSELPRNTDCTKFLVPAFEGVDKVCLTHYLKMFCSFFLPGDKTYPTCNLLRKWFHTEMRKLANNPDNLKKLMMKIDPHGEAVMDRHYILKSPQDHVDIAKVVYNAIMGEVTAWPSDEEVVNSDVVKFWDQKLADDFEEDRGFHHDDEYEEEGWEWGPLFGFSSVVPDALAIADGEASEDMAAPQDAGCQDMPLVPAEPIPASGSQKRNMWEAREAAKAFAAVKKAKKDKHYSSQYWQAPDAPGVIRAQPLDPIQSEWIMGELAKWQDQHAGGDRTQMLMGPGSAEFYRDMRCDGIDAGHLQPWHSQDICRSHITSKLRQLRKAGAQPVEESQPGEEPGEDVD